ncbi:MAG: response regulator [Proteobacteria bacterium]|nr:response regulator [Pseudomonadota bacterium]
MNEKQAPILVVDDEPEMCWILENIIRRTGFTCMTALNAGEAMALTKSNKFGMAFLDAKLPDIDGLDLARKLRKTNAHLPIVIVSGYFYQDDPTIEGVLQEGLINAFVGKPFDHDEIVSVITRYACR